jgi:hypothetical protein
LSSEWIFISPDPLQVYDKKCWHPHLGWNLSEFTKQNENTRYHPQYVQIPISKHFQQTKIRTILSRDQKVWSTDSLKESN